MAQKNGFGLNLAALGRFYRIFYQHVFIPVHLYTSASLTSASLNQSVFNQSIWRRAHFIQNCIQMHKGFIHRKGVHLPPVLVVSSLNGRFQVMTSNLDGKRISDDSPGLFVVLHPGWMRHSDPHGMAVHDKFDVDGIRVARSYSYNERLIEAVEFLGGPAVGCVKVFVHCCKNDIGDWPERQVTSQNEQPAEESGFGGGLHNRVIGTSGGRVVEKQNL